MIDRRSFIAGSAALLATGATASAQGVRPADWDGILARARGQTVFWNAWGGDERTNAFIAWVGEETRRRFGVSITHVRLRDTAEAVTKVIAERQAGRDAGGGVDLIWINGPNFATMKAQRLLHGPFAEALPNWRFVDTETKRSNIVDFTLPVEGMASPWLLAQLVYVFDSARTPRASLPRSIPAFLAYARANPGRITHPQARNFLGATFLKQALYELAADPEALQVPATDQSFAAVTAPLWTWYDALRPNMWRQGRQFPESGPAQRQLLADGEIDFYATFNPSEGATSVITRELPPSTRVMTLARGTIGNTSFVAIPYNAAHKEGAMVVANTLIEPAVQARAQNPAVLGQFSVLAVERLPPAERALFDRPAGAPEALPTNADLGTVLPEPHPSWMTRITAEWERRVQG
jgi:putative thiamine transport system substrate-binding protein